MFSKAATVFYIHDFSKQVNRYISGDFESLVGYPRERSLTEAYFILKIIHQEDRNFLFTIVQKAFIYIDSLSSDLKKSCVLKLNYRIIKNNGEIKWISEHITLMEMDKEGKPTMACGFMTDISYLKPGKIHCEINTCDGGVYLISNEDNNAGFSKRELEVLRLIDKGFSSKEVASNLKISVYTVNNHRRNIMQRFESQNIIEVLSKARKEKVL